ncbi:DUF998 domain-containing protein [Dictyobacter kobayashii]|uniref:DUF998 domain-containing protein n=1 Tax=Dictyobacter kobayashii TaxID=2014872 RepID=A0A402AQD5_9CHLR|nr:DUF998 domain-containing protein [Dictyobacter kobayashii]GCE21327.1 hypothetical protein KDK_51270 [Dictyobacter kobayashii]
MLAFGTPSVSISRGRTRGLLWAGIIAPILFAATFMIDGFLKPGYSVDNEAISYLEVGAYGWVQQANFIIFGLLLVVFLVGYMRVMRPILGQGWLYAASVFLILSDIGWIMSGLFIPNTFLGPQFTWPAIMHQIAFDMVFLPLTIGWLILGIKCLFTRGWRGYGIYSLIIGIPLCAFTSIAVINLLDPAAVAGIIGNQNAPHDGIINRVMLLIAPLAWYIISAAIGLRLAKRQPETSTAQPISERA